MRRILHYLLKFIASRWCVVSSSYHWYHWRREAKPPRNAIEAVLRPSFRVRANIKSYNNELGCPHHIRRTRMGKYAEWLLLFAQASAFSWELHSIHKFLYLKWVPVNQGILRTLLL